MKRPFASGKMSERQTRRMESEEQRRSRGVLKESYNKVRLDMYTFCRFT